MESITDINLGAIQLTDLLNGVIAFVFAALMAFVTTPLARVIAYKIGAIDIPKDNRRMHKRPLPRLGGLAIAFSFIVSILLFYDVSNETLGMIIGAFMIILIGIVDDVLRIRAVIKFVVMIAAAGVAVSQGVLIERIHVFGEWIHFGHFAIPLTILWIVGLTNAVNLIDGLDGLACGISTISAVSLLVVTILIGDFKLALMIAILAGASIGFLPFNRNPSKIIMGDTGAMFLGFILAVVSIQGVFKTHAVTTFIIPFLILGVPIFDTLFAMFRRVLTGRSPFSADRGHLHHRLIDMGFNQKQSVRILYAVSAILGISSVMLITHQIVYAVVIIALSLGLSAVMWIIFRDEKMKYESGLMDRPEELEAGEPIQLLAESNPDEQSIDLSVKEAENEKVGLKPAKAGKAKR